MQARVVQNDLWEQEIVPRLPQELAEQAKALGALQRKRGVKMATPLLRAVLCWVLCQRSLRQLGVWAVLLGIANLSETAWRKRLAKCGDWLNWLLQVALGKAQSTAVARARVVVVDGTMVRPPGGTGKEEWLVQISYDIEAGALMDVRVGDTHLAETRL